MKKNKNRIKKNKNKNKKNNDKKKKKKKEEEGEIDLSTVIKCVTMRHLVSFFSWDEQKGRLASVYFLC